jgi:phage-related protein
MGILLQMSTISTVSGHRVAHGHRVRSTVLILEVFEKKTGATPMRVIEMCKERLRRYERESH